MITPTGHGRRRSTAGPDELADLMRLVAVGDVAAFAQLYDALAPRVFGLIQRILRDHAQSEEVTQEVMFNLWRTAARYHPADGSVITWTFTMAHRRAVDRVRSEQVHQRLDREAVARSATIEFDQTAEQVLRNSDGERVRQSLACLTYLEREAILLAYYQGHTYVEVAEILDASLPTIKSRIRAGLLRLRKRLDETEDRIDRR